MLIAVDELVRIFKVAPNGVLHVGAHLAEEAEMYENFNWQGESKIYWVESQSDLVARLAVDLDPSIHQVTCATVWNVSGEHLQFNHTNNSQSSSLLDLFKHSEKYPGITVDRSYEVVTSRIDELFPSANFDFVALDIQGAELKALEGMGDLLNDIKWIYSEVNKIELYRGCALVEDLDLFLSKKGFTRAATRWAWRSGWGDALWVRNDLMVNPILPNLKSKAKNVWLILFYSFRYVVGRIFVKRA